MVDFALTDENRLVRQSARAFAEAEILPHIHDWDEKGGFPRELFGRMGEEVLLSGCRALPTRLERSGFRFELPDLPAALSRTLGKGV